MRVLIDTSYARRGPSGTGVYVEQRVRASVALLETTDQPVEWVGARSGFPAPASYRRHFRRVVGVSPSQYRRTFAASSAA